MLKAASIGILLLLIPSVVRAQLPQQLSFQKYTTKDGLANNNCHNIVEDEQHFIWVSTIQGVSRFDGTQIQNYVLNKDPFSTATSVTSVLKDAKGHIWALNNSSLLKYNATTNTFDFVAQIQTSKQQRQSKKKQQKQKGGSLIPIALDSTRNCFWLTAEDQLFRFNFSTQKLAFVATIAIDNVVQFVRLNSNLLVFSGNNEWLIYDIVSKRQQKTPHPKGIYNVFSDGQNRLWYTDETAKIWQILHKNGTLLAPTLLKDFGSQSFVYSLTTLPKITGDSILWCSVADAKAGIHLVDLNKKNDLSTLTKNVNQSNGFEYLFIKFVFNDTKNNLWVATDDGVFRANLSSFQIQTELFPFFRPLGIKRVRQVMQHPADPNLQWIATSQHGLYLYDKSTQKVVRKFYFENRNIAQIKYDSQRRLWVLSEGKIWIIDKKYAVKAFSLDSLKFDLTVWGTQFDENQTAWLNTEIGLIRFDEKARKFKLFQHLDNNEQSLSDDRVRVMKIRRDKTIALGTATGIDIFDPKSEQVVGRIGKRAEVYGINEDAQRTLWATYDRELVKIVGIKVVKSWTKNGANQPLLFKNNIFIDNAGTIWGDLVNGLLNFDPMTEKFSMFTEKDGLISNYSYGNIYENEGNLYLNHEYGVNYFDPLQPRSNPKDYVTKMTTFEIFGKRQAVDFTQKESFKVNYEQNILTFNFTVAEYQNPEKILFRHQLEGFEKRWSVPENKHSVTYTNLDGGDYTFKVQAIDETGKPSPQMAVFKIHVTTPYYRSWWFLSLGALVVFGIFYAFYNSRINRLLELQNLRNAISRDLHDEIGSTLSSISMLSATASLALDKDPSQSKNLIETISNNAQKMLESMDDIVWAINPREDSFENIMVRMREYVYGTMEAKNIEVNFKDDPQLTKLSLPMRERRNLYLIFKETVNNAAKHAACTRIEIIFELKANILSMTIGDNGRGFDVQKSNNRNGLRNIRQRATEIGGHLTINSPLNQGTKIYFSIKV